MSSNPNKHYRRSSSGDSNRYPRKTHRSRTGDAEYKNDEEASSSRNYKSSNSLKRYRSRSRSKSNTSSSSYEKHRLSSHHKKEERLRSPASVSPQRYKQLPQAYRRKSPTLKKNYKNGLKKGNSSSEKLSHRSRKSRSISPKHSKAKIPYFINEAREQDRYESRLRASSPAKQSYLNAIREREKVRSHYGRPRTPDEPRYEHYRRSHSPPQRNRESEREYYEKVYKDYGRKYDDGHYKSEYLATRTKDRSRSRSRERFAERYAYENHKSFDDKIARLDKKYERIYEASQAIVAPQIIPVPVPVPAHTIYNGAMFPAVSGHPIGPPMRRFPSGPRMGPLGIPRRMHPPRLLPMSRPVRIPYLRPRMPPRFPPNHIIAPAYWS